MKILMRVMRILFLLSICLIPTTARFPINDTQLQFDTSEVGLENTNVNISAAVLPTRLKLQPDRTSSSIPRRQIDQGLKSPQQCYETGICMMEMITGVGPPGRYTDYSSIQQAGWEGGNQGSDTGIGGLNDFIEGLGMNVNDFSFWAFRYVQTWIPDALGEPYVGGYRFLINTKAGVIVRYYSQTPKNPMVPPGHPIPNPPPIKQWSDFAFLVWRQACNNDDACIRGLEWVVCYHVVNPTSSSVAQQILNQMGGIWATWPGVSVDANSQAGLTLLGTPNGYGGAWMLVNQVTELGPKTFDVVHLFRADDRTMHCLAFHVVDNIPAPPAVGS